MRTEQLHYFTLAYEMRNYAAAAGCVPMTKTGFVKAIDSLSKSLGCELFTQDRSGALRPTVFADELFNFARQFESNIDLLNSRFDKFHAQQNSTIRFGAAQGMLASLGPCFLSQFYKQNPGISIEINENNDVRCEEGLLAENFDIALTLAPFNRSLVTTELYTEEICYWIPASNPLSKKDKLVAEDFSGLKVATPGKGFKCYDTLTGACTKAGVSLGEVYECSQIYRIYEYVAQGYGIGFTLPSVVGLSCFRNNPGIINVQAAGFIHQLGISYRPTHPLTEPEQKFYNYCIEYSKNLISCPE